MFVIDKAKSPRCFKRVKHLPCRYRSQKNSWMDGILFGEWICEIGRQFTKGRRNIDNLVSTEFVFLPPSTTWKLQLME